MESKAGVEYRQSLSERGEVLGGGVAHCVTGGPGGMWKLGLSLRRGCQLQRLEAGFWGCRASDSWERN